LLINKKGLLKAPFCYGFDTVYYYNAQSNCEKQGGFMKHKIFVGLALLMGITSMVFAAQRMVLCEDLYQEG
jgi:hypothetical protein